VKKICVITGLPAKYVDPISGHPYANLQAYKEIKKKFHNSNHTAKQTTLNPFPTITPVPIKTSSNPTQPSLNINEVNKTINSPALQQQQPLIPETSSTSVVINETSKLKIKLISKPNNEIPFVANTNIQSILNNNNLATNVPIMDPNLQINPTLPPKPVVVKKERKKPAKTKEPKESKAKTEKLKKKPKTEKQTAAPQVPSLPPYVTQQQNLSQPPNQPHPFLPF
jgi:hypothetical protein